MAVLFRQALTTTKNATGTTYTPARPSGAVAGDFLWATFSTDGATVTNTPSGWTQRVAITAQSGLKSYAYSKFYVAGDANPGFTLSSAVRVGGCMAAFSGVDPTTPIDVTPVTANGSSGAVDPPSLTGVSADALVIVTVGQDSTSDTFSKGTVPSGYTRAASASSQSKGFGYKASPSAGGTENPASWSTASTALQWTASTTALRPSLVTLLLNLTDLTAFATALDTAIASATGSDLTDLNRIKTALGTPSALPLAPEQYQQGDGDIRVLVLSAQNGRKQNVVDLFDRSWQLGSPNEFLRAIMKDTRTSAQDPWGG